VGWKDGCPSCGGHPNSSGVLLHRAGCVMNEDLGSPWAAPVLAQRDSFYTGLLHTLTVHELHVSHMTHPANVNTIMAALTRVISRFPDAEVTKEVRDEILSLVKKEVIDGGSNIPTPST